VRVHHPCYTESDVAQMSDAEYDAMYDQFVVELMTNRPSERLVIASIAWEPTLGQTIARVISLLDRHGADHPQARLSAAERLEIPIIDLDRTHRYAELFGRQVTNPPLSGQQFGEVVERVRFRLDEGGVFVESEAIGRGLCLPPRELVFSSPFLVLILRRGARVPQFALWVDNDDVLVPASLPVTL